MFDLADKMVPEAFKELIARLKVLQQLVYRGEMHEIATGGMPKIRREAEAYLDERKLARQIRRGRFPSAACAADGTESEALVRAKYQPKIDEGWPNLFGKQVKCLCLVKKLCFWTSLHSTAKSRRWTLSNLLGKTISGVW